MMTLYEMLTFCTVQTAATSSPLWGGGGGGVCVQENVGLIVSSGSTRALKTWLNYLS